MADCPVHHIELDNGECAVCAIDGPAVCGACDEGEHELCSIPQVTSLRSWDDDTCNVLICCCGPSHEEGDWG